MASPSHIGHWRFNCFLAAQFLGAFNDNVFKLVVTMAALSLFTEPRMANTYVALASAMSILPFVLFSGYAGYFADRYSRRRVLIVAKAFEVPGMAAACALLAFGLNVDGLLGVLFLISAQSAFFSPAKYGILPDVMPPEQLTRANGWLNMLTYLAIITGTVTGGALWQHFSDTPVLIGGILVGLAVTGTVLVLAVPAPAHKPAPKPFHWNPLHELLQAAPVIKRNRVLLWATIGSAAFWGLGGLLYQCLLVLGREVLGVSETAASALFSFLAIGIGIGSLACGWRSGERVRLELIPWGLLLMAGGCVLVWPAVPDYALVAALMVLVGIGGGLYVVPLSTTIQKESPPERRGQVIATGAFLDMLAVLFASFLFWLLNARLGLLPQQTLALIGGAALVALLLVLVRAPVMTIRAARPLLVLLLRAFYRVEVHGPRPATAGQATIIASNHVSLVDGFILSSLFPEARAMVQTKYWQHPVNRWLLTGGRAIPFSPSVKDTRQGLEAARAVLQDGGMIGLFPEGAITRTGHQRAFRRGIEALAAGLPVQVIPMHIHGLFGSGFSCYGGRFFRIRPRLRRRRVTVTFGPALPGDAPAWEVGRTVALLGVKAASAAVADHQTLGRLAIHALRQQGFRPVMSDTTGASLNGVKALTGARLVQRWLARQLRPDEARVGVLLPAGVGAALVNLALAFMGKTAVNLNFSLGQETASVAARKAGLKAIITAQKFLDKLEWAPDPAFRLLEDMKASVTGAQRLRTLLASLLPAAVLCRFWLRGEQRADATAALLFSSGTTAEPKGVMLSHRGTIANIRAVAVQLGHAERSPKTPLPLASALPVFHSFGFTVCLWLPLLTGRRVAWHASPLDAKTMVKLIRDSGAGMTLTTPTFAASYIRAAKPGDLDGLKFLVTGGEKLTDTVYGQLRAALPAASILQGYGCTELGPVVSVNVPDVVEGGRTFVGTRPGSVGLPLPGVAVVACDRETLAPLPPGGEGVLRIQSAAVMQGYWGQPDLTATVVREGWYDTGDIGYVDNDGFIHITDRLARFSKIGGEMVPHGKVEAAIDAILGDRCSVVLSLPDAKKGERLGVLYVSDALEPAELADRLQQSGLPSLWIPRRDAMARVAELPLLATGKVDLRTAGRMLSAFIG